MGLTYPMSQNSGVYILKSIKGDQANVYIGERVAAASCKLGKVIYSYGT